MSETLISEVLEYPSRAFSERKGLPSDSCVYFLMLGSTCLYIGKSVNLKERWLKHHRTEQMEAIDGVRIAWRVTAKSDLDKTERQMIAALQPLLNGQSLPKRPRKQERTQFFDDLEAAITEAGGQKPFARSVGISEGHLSYILAGRREPAKKLLNAMGYQKIVRYTYHGTETE